MKTTTRILLRDGWKDVPALTNSSLPLVVTRTWETTRGSFEITHTASGWTALHIDGSLAKAKKYLEKLLAVGNWDRCQDEIWKDKPFCSAVIQIRREARFE